MRFSIFHVAPSHRDRSATYLPVSIPRALVVDSGEVHSRDLSVYSLTPVAAEDVVAVEEAHCRPLAGHGGSAEAVVVLDSAGVVVGSTTRCMPPPGDTGLAGAVSDPGLVESVASTHLHLAVCHIAGHMPSPLAAHSGHCPIARFQPDRSHNRNIAGRNGHRTPGTAAVAVPVVVVLGRGIAVAVVRDCKVAGVPFWRRYRRAPPMCLSRG
jgi:hypothetical protein